MTSVLPVEDDVPFSNTVEYKEEGADSDGYHVKKGHEEEQDGASAHQDQARGPPLLGGRPTAGSEGEDRETTARAVEASAALEKDSAVIEAIEGRTQAGRDRIEGRRTGEEEGCVNGSEEGEEEEERTSGGRTSPEKSSSRRLLQRTASADSAGSNTSRQSSVSEPVREHLYGENGDDLFGAEDGQGGALGGRMDDYHDQTWPPMLTDDVYTPDGKLVVGRRVTYADEVGDNMEFVAFSENLHYSRRNMDYVEDVQYREGGCCVIA